MSKPKILTSLNSPLVVAGIELGPGFGRIGMTLCPGKKDARSPLGRAWDRDLATDLAALKAVGTDVLVTLVESWELQYLQVPDLQAQVRAAGMLSVHLPIRDMSVPGEGWEATWAAGVGADLRSALLDRAGTVVVHCRGGLGRAGTVACRLLVDCGWHPLDALAMVRLAREGAVENEDQEAYVRAATPLPTP